MATIRLVPDRINSMPGFISEAEGAFGDMGESLFSLREAALLISPEIISMDDVVAEAGEAAEFCDVVEASLGSFREEMENFIRTVVEVDAAVAELIERRTEEFYRQYEHLRPECEKDFWDRATDWFDGVVKWCEDNWKTIAIILLVVFAVVACVFIPALAPLGAAILTGMLLGGASGGLSNLAMGFLEGKRGSELFDCFTQGLADGILMGGIMGSLGWAGGMLGSAVGLCKVGNVLGTIGKAFIFTDLGLDAFDLAAFGLGVIDPDNWLTEFNGTLYQSDAYNYARLGISMGAAFAGGMEKTLNCFVAGTLVLTAAGLVAIEKIRAGDLVMASDENGNRGLKRVVRTFARQTDSIVTVNAGEMAIRCTPEHPFFVEGKGFVYASDLETGNILVTEAGGCVMVSSVDKDETVSVENTVTVYNFEVEDWHTYYAGEWCVLVHNMCAKINNGTLSDDRVDFYYNEAQNKMDSDTAVFGQCGNYENIGQKVNFAHYHMEDKMWYALVEECGGNFDEVWKPNKKFIDEIIASGKRIIFADDPDAGYYLPDGSPRFTQREINYFRELGYGFRDLGNGTWEAVK